MTSATPSAHSFRSSNIYRPFRMAITTSSSPQNFVLPFLNSGRYRCIIDWGDGSTEKITVGTNGLTHSYTTAGTYEINIKGLYTHLDFSVITTSRLLVSEIREWGNNFWKKLNFYSCDNMTANYVAGDKPITFQITDMFRMFSRCFNFNGSVEGWDVSNVTTMESMFDFATSFNQDLNSWKPTKCQNMSFMFRSATLFNNGGVAWTGPNFGPNLGSVTNMTNMFLDTSTFNQSVGNWNVTGVTDMSSMFSITDLFDQPLDTWDVSNVISMNAMFSRTQSFNQDLNSWIPSSCQDIGGMFSESTSFNNGGVAWTGPNFGPNLGNVTRMNAVFLGSVYNNPIGNWDVSGVTIMNSMFLESSFNQDLNAWTPSSCQEMGFMFSTSSFNNGGVAFTGPNFGPNMGNVINISNIFESSNFNQRVDNWNTSSVQGIAFAFLNATSFNQPLGDWDVSSVTSFFAMFNNASAFNQDLNGWTPSSCLSTQFMFQSATSFNNGGVAWTGPNFGPNLGNVTSMSSMFSNATNFDQSIGGFNVSSTTTMTNILDNTSLSITNVNDTINGWATLAGTTGVNSGLTVGMTGLTADVGSSGSRLVLTSAPNNWTFSGLTVI